MERLSAEEVKAARAKLGMTQAQLGEALGGLGKDAVKDWERGRRPCQGPAALLLKQLSKGATK